MTLGTQLSARELARLLDLPQPTAEQERIVSADLRPRAVVAGAGSGKSETVASRVVWLVANGIVHPDQVLGLTFTRKAAGELSDRVRRRLGQLGDAGVVSSTVLDGEPTVSTYHAYAARLVADHALREAHEPSLRLITPAVQWQLAARVVSAYDGPMDAVTWAPDTVVTAVLELAGELGEHLRWTDDVRAEGERLRQRAELLPGRAPAAVTRLLRQQRAREQLLALVERYAREKAAREVMDHSDQVALAARIAERHPEVGAIERSRHQVVLLDEYQDTGYAQLALLWSLFGGGHPVMAVGDPCQSIYGWRGAAAGNLNRFSTDFPPPHGAEEPETATLSTSFRGGQRILDVAGGLSARLRQHTEVPPMRPGPDRVGRGRAVCGLFESAQAEASWIAEQLRGVLDLPEGRAPDGQPWPGPASGVAADGAGSPAADAETRAAAGGPRVASAAAAQATRVEPVDVAVLARKRAQFPALRHALEERGIPVEVVGLGGLLTVPEVSDVVATLRVLWDPATGNALARLLTGPRWRIGPPDLVALGQRGRELARMTDRDVATGESGEPGDGHGTAARAGDGSGGSMPADGDERVDADPVQRAVADMTAEQDASLVDALDDLGPPERYSPAGYARLSALASELRGLRTRVDQPLPDLVTDVERTLGLDIEVATRPGLDPVSARADLDAFVDAAARFAGDEEEPTLGAFLAYLSAAEDQEFGLEAGRVSESNSVKLMTVHAAKGLEWPVVAVPGLSAGEQARVFPAKPRTSTMWTDNPRKLPFPLRGDRAELPELRDVDRESYERFAAACKEREEIEERRLAYVAATRASFLLLCSGYWWGSGKTPLGPSIFLREVRDACRAGAGEVAEWAPEPAEDAENPSLQESAVAPWPADPAGPRQEAIAEGARLVEEALARHPDSVADRDGEGHDGGAVRLAEDDRERAAGWALDERLLLAEREQASAAQELEVELPTNLSVSALVTLARDPAELARQIRRPMPRPPAPQARRGSAFHRWLESRYVHLRLLDPDDVPGAADEDAAPDEDLAELQRCFHRSAWASATPVDVEVPFETVVGDRLVRGRMDAVFRDGDGTYDVVDWKTGIRPAGAEADAAAVQLAAYRVAWAELAGVSLDRVRAAFHYVRTDETVRPVDLLDADRLTALIQGIPFEDG